MEVELLISSTRLCAVGIASSFAMTALAAILCVSPAQAAQQKKPAAATHPAAPHVTPHVATPRVTTPHVATPHVNAQVHANTNVNKSVQHEDRVDKSHKKGKQSPSPTPSAQLANPALQKTNPKLGPQNSPVVQNPNALKLGPGKPNFTPVGLKPGPSGFQQIKPAFPAVAFKNKFFPIFKGPHFMWVGGFKKFFVPVGVLGVVFIGGSYWYPDGYIAIDGPSCGGFTPDGCQLHWRMVDFADGGGEPQCVQYCPRSGPPPAQVATLPPPPPLPSNGACQVTIFSDPNFAGTSAPTGDSQPALSQTGWRNEISSIQVQSGTWDFFTDENFGGEQMRLPPGPYPLLAPEWSKKIGSFMCVQPGPRA
jgi:Beta/Gamma crystallin